MPRKNLDSYVGDTYVLFRNVMLYQAGPSGRSAKNVVLRPLTYSDCGFESHWGGAWMSVVSVLCCRVEVSSKGVLLTVVRRCV